MNNELQWNYQTFDDYAFASFNYLKENYHTFILMISIQKWFISDKWEMKNQASFLLLSRNFESCYMSKKENLRSLLAIKSDSGHISESV